MFTDGSLSEILMKSSLARLVNMLLDVLRVRKLFHRRMWFLMSHLSCSWREVLITLFEEHIRKNLRHLRSLCSSASGYNFYFFLNVKSRCKTVPHIPLSLPVHVVSCYSFRQVQSFTCTDLASSNYTCT